MITLPLLLLLAVDPAAAPAGQYAPPVAGAKFPVWSKGCARFAAVDERLACLEYVAQDWTRFGRYAEANRLVQAPAKSERRVVFYGDSITDNWSRSPAGFFAGKPYFNRGIGGQTTAQMVLRFRADVLALAPKAVVILAGTNDLAGNTGPTTVAQIADNLTTMAELAKLHGIRVVLASVLPVCDCTKDADGKSVLRTGDRKPDEIRALNSWMANYARKNGHVYLDYHQAMVSAAGADDLKAELTGDGLHPNAAGYAVMAPLAEKAIAAALKR